jgi:hypothetical protein
MTARQTLYFPASAGDAPAQATQANPMPVAAWQDAWMAHALNEIEGTYGDVVSIYNKAKSLNKFGRTANADSGIRTTVATFGSVATINVNETYETTDAIDSIASSSGSDTEILTLEGHTIDGSGNLTFSTQEVTLTGQTPVTLGTALARASRLTVKDGTFGSPSNALVGDIYVYKSGGTVTAGVPQTSADVKLRVIAGRNQSEKCATSLSQFDYWILTGIDVSMERAGGGSTAVDFEIETRQLGGVWHPLGMTIDVDKETPFQQVVFTPYRIIPPNADVRVVATSDTADTTISAELEGVLALIAA